MTDINSIIEMINKLREDERNLLLDSNRYILACDDIIEQLRKMSDEEPSEALMQAHMDGQSSAGVDPSYSIARAYALERKRLHAK